MSHDDSSIPSADKEGNELWIATYGNIKDPSSHAPVNTALGDGDQIKNKPRRSAGESVKHSDFNIDGVNMALHLHQASLAKGEETHVDVQFINAGQGFLDEIRHNPNNFTWYVKPGDEDKIRITSVQTTTTPADYGKVNDATQHEFGAYRIKVQNIQACGSEAATGHIVCKFKDGFNGHLTASEGYDVELTGAITLEKTELQMTIAALPTTNARVDAAYDNGLSGVDLSQSLPGQNGLNKIRYKNNDPDSGEVLATLDNCQDIVIGNSQSIACNSQTLLNNITQVDVEWKKYDGASDQWKQVLGHGDINTRYRPATPNAWNGANVGVLMARYQNNQKNNYHTQARLYVQGQAGTGKYRATVTVKGSISGQGFECVFDTNDVEVNIYDRISPFTVGPAQAVWSSTGAQPNTIDLPVTPYPLTRNTDKWIAYELYKHDSSGYPQRMTTRVIVWRNNGDPFTIPVPAEAGCYSVLASWVNGDGQGGAGDTDTGGWGSRWSESRQTGNTKELFVHATPPTDGASQLAEWRTKSSYRRIHLDPQIPRNITVQKDNMWGTAASFYWDKPNGLTGDEVVTYQAQVWSKSSEAAATYLVAMDWNSEVKGRFGKDSSDNKYSVGSTYTWDETQRYFPMPTQFCYNSQQRNTVVKFHVRTVLTANQWLYASGDTNLTIASSTYNWKTHIARSCVYLRANLMPRKLIVTTKASKADGTNPRPWWSWSNYNNKNYFGWSYSSHGTPHGSTRTGWQHYFSLPNTTRSQHYKVFYRTRGQTAWSEATTQLGGVTLTGRTDGKWINGGDSTHHNFFPNHVFNANQEIRFQAFTRYTDATNTSRYCDSVTEYSAVHRVPNVNGVYSYSGNIADPINTNPLPSKTHHGGKFKTIESHSWVTSAIGMSGGWASDVKNFAGGIFGDNSPRLRVKGINHPDRDAAPSSSGVKVGIPGYGGGWVNYGMNLPVDADPGTWTLDLYTAGGTTCDWTITDAGGKSGGSGRINRSSGRFLISVFGVKARPQDLEFKNIGRTSIKTLTLQTLVWKPVNRPQSPQRKYFSVPRGETVAGFNKRGRKFTRAK